MTSIGGGGVCAISGRDGIYDVGGLLEFCLLLQFNRCLQMQKLPVKKDE